MECVLSCDWRGNIFTWGLRIFMHTISRQQGLCQASHSLGIPFPRPHISTCLTSCGDACTLLQSGFILHKLLLAITSTAGGLHMLTRLLCCICVPAVLRLRIGYGNLCLGSSTVTMVSILNTQPREIWRRNKEQGTAAPATVHGSTDRPEH